MNSILNKKDFYKMVLRDRYAISNAEFILGRDKRGKIEFFCTPLGTLVCARVGDSNLREIKMYDRSGGKFEVQNVFCGENLTEIESGVFVGVSGRLQIEDTFGRSFLIKLDGISIVVRVEMISKDVRKVDKKPLLVYN